MFAGHFGVAAAVKSKTPELPLWTLLVSSQLLDLMFIPFSFAGLESIEPIGEGGYANVIINAYYSHALVTALILAVLGGCLAGWFWNKKAAFITGTVIFSHWILDLIVHRPDLPILPGNIGNFPLLGLGLWESVPASIFLEFLLIAIGSIFYFKSALQSSDPTNRGKSIAAGCAMIIFLLLTLGIDTSL